MKHHIHTTIPQNVPGANREIEPLLFPSLSNLYAHRSACLRKACEHSTEDAKKQWYVFLSRLVDRQKQLLMTSHDARHVAQLGNLMKHASKEHSLCEEIGASQMWDSDLQALAQIVKDALSVKVFGQLDTLLGDEKTCQAFVEHVLKYDYQPQQAGVALVVRLALSSFLARTLSFRKEEILKATEGEHHDLFCPVCGGLPVGSVVGGGTREGLRYLQCSLCETKWHKVFGVCLVCGEADGIELWDNKEDFTSAVQVEACRRCHFFSKLIRHDRDPSLELVCEDLFSMQMDRYMEDKHYQRVGINPFSLPVAKGDN